MENECGTDQKWNLTRQELWRSQRKNDAAWYWIKIVFADREQALRWKNSGKPPSWPWCRGRRDKTQRIRVGDDVSVTLINPLWTFPVVVVIQSLSPFWLCNPMDCNLPGSSVRGISQAKIQDWVAISSSRGASQPRDCTHVSCKGRWILYHWATWEVVKTPCSHFRVHSFHPGTEDPTYCPAK